MDMNGITVNILLPVLMGILLQDTGPPVDSGVTVAVSKSGFIYTVDISRTVVF